MEVPLTPYRGKFAVLTDDFTPAKTKKRPRHSSGASLPTQAMNFNTAYKSGPSTEQFLNMNQDEKLLSMFELLGNLGPLKYRVDNVEQHMYYSSAIHTVSDARLHLLEYKSIDNEARQRQTNLIFSGHKELFSEDCK